VAGDVSLELLSLSSGSMVIVVIIGRVIVRKDVSWHHQVNVVIVKCVVVRKDTSRIKSMSTIIVIVVIAIPCCCSL
jgi:hypothetical protein